MKPKLKLYCVTIPWDANDHETGDYAAKFWATGTAAAVEMCATEMADSNTEKMTRKERKALIEAYIDGSYSYAAEDVACSVKSDLHDLLAGPKNEMSKEANHVYRVILDLLALHGVGEGS